MHEMLSKVADLTVKHTPCWGAFKVRAVSKDASVNMSKFIGFQYIPAKAKINAKRVAKEVAETAKEVLKDTSMYIETDNLEQISSTVNNVEEMRAGLSLEEGFKVQLNIIYGVDAVAKVTKEIRDTPLDDFSYTLINLEDTP